MCGIFGVLNKNNLDVDTDLFESSVNLLAHRGPNDKGFFFKNEVALGHTRLSIKDLTVNGNQPMRCKKTGVTLIYNGELYNHNELKGLLVSIGYEFISSSDTEVVLYSFIAWGIDCFKKFNGMFSLSFYDPRTMEVVVARDRFGIKPLYLFESEKSLMFSSEIKAIKSYMGTDVSGVNFNGLSEYLFYGNALGSNTLFKNISKVRPAEYLIINLVSFNIKRNYYWEVKNIIPNNNISYKDATFQTKIFLRKSVESHLDSDVPVGILLSGGIDSSAITAFASQASDSPVKTFCAGFDYKGATNELSEAKMVAQKFNTEHHEIHILGSELESLIPSLVDIHDEPFADAANIPLYLISKQLNKDVSVVLQGDGGDEVFGGYNRYSVMSQYYRWFSLSLLMKPFYPILASILTFQAKSRFMESLSQLNVSRKFAMLLSMETLRQDPRALMQGSYLEQTLLSNPFQEYEDILKRMPERLDHLQKLLYTDMQILLPCTFLEKVDKPTMSNSVEVRVPFLDKDLTDFVLPLPSKFKADGRNKKKLLKDALRGVVPDFILDAPKKGLNVPYSYWLKTSLKKLFIDTMHRGNENYSHIINYNKILNMHKLHCNGKNDFGPILWKILMLTFWLEKNSSFI